MTDGFGLDNLPYGAVARPGGPAQLAARIGDEALLLAPLKTGLPLDGETLNPLLALGRPAWDELREIVREAAQRGAETVPLSELEPRLPVAIGDYVDFYSSLEHATNLGRLFRPDTDPLLPNWRHLPVGYHGRASSVVISGTPIRRPHGQLPTERAPVFGPTQRLDIELELGFITGPGNELGTSISTADAPDHVFGFVLVNDWSARDIQRWEYQPLGPFLGKSFATSISPWVVPLAALEPFRVPAPPQDPPPLDYLRTDRRLGARHRARGRAQRRGDLPHERARAVLDVPATARPRHRQRHQRPARRPVRVRDDLRPRARERGQPDRARALVPAGRRHGRAARRRRRARLVRRGRRHHRGLSAFLPPGGGPLTVTGVTGAHRFGVLVLNSGAFGH